MALLTSKLKGQWKPSLLLILKPLVSFQSVPVIDHFSLSYTCTFTITEKLANQTQGQQAHLFWIPKDSRWCVWEPFRLRKASWRWSLIAGFLGAKNKRCIKPLLEYYRYEILKMYIVHLYAQKITNILSDSIVMCQIYLTYQWIHEFHAFFMGLLHQLLHLLGRPEIGINPCPVLRGDRPWVPTKWSLHLLYITATNDAELGPFFPCIFGFF